MSLFKSIGNFVKDIIPGKIDDAIIDTVFKEGTGEKIKESFFPSSKSSSQSQVGESFFNLRDRISESGARRGTTLSRYTGETPARYTRFLTPPVAPPKAFCAAVANISVPTASSGIALSISPLGIRPSTALPLSFANLVISFKNLYSDITLAILT